MVLEPEARTLLILAGQRDERYLSDMYAYHIPTGTVTELFSNFTAIGGPDACFTQRSVIDPELREIYLCVHSCSVYTSCLRLTFENGRFCGLTRSQPGSLTVLETDSPYWIYRYERADRPGTWTPIPPIEQARRVGPGLGPQPRYAHQVVYDAGNKAVYMHGGNNGIIMDDGNNSSHAEGNTARGRPVLDGGDATKENRLDDFWKMTLERYVVSIHGSPAHGLLHLSRPPVEDIVRRAIYELRQQQ